MTNFFVLSKLGKEQKMKKWHSENLTELRKKFYTKKKREEKLKIVINEKFWVFSKNKTNR